MSLTLWPGRPQHCLVTQALLTCAQAVADPDRVACGAATPDGESPSLTACGPSRGRGGPRVAPGDSGAQCQDGREATLAGRPAVLWAARQSPAVCLELILLLAQFVLIKH